MQDANPENFGRRTWEAVMGLKNALKSVLGKAVLATVVLGGLISFFGVSSASAATVIVERRPVVVVRGGFYGPRYYGPRERIFIAPHRFWDARYRCWRYR
jgi:hypothetical protein